MSTRPRPIRVGIVGAGSIARTRHLPGLLAIPGVEIVAVCNRSRDSASRIAREWNIPRVHGAWESLVEDESIDAVVVGAWPYLHYPVTLAALDAGKHVLTQARLAMSAREAQRMHDKALEKPELTAMVVPSPYGLTGDELLRRMIEDGFLGSLRELHVTGMNADLADPLAPIGWRQRARYSGFNMLTLGILHETAARWTAPATRVWAWALKTIPERVEPESGERVRVGTPDSVQVVTTQADGSRGLYRLSGVTWHAPGLSIEMYGSHGTIRYDLSKDRILAARRDEGDLRELVVPEELRGRWRVEEEFIAAIRGEEPVRRSTFADGVRYMQFTEAVARSSRHQIPVDLPLTEFSHPGI